MEKLIAESLPAEVRIFLSHVYEYKKGVRRMVLYTLSRKYLSFVTQRLKGQGISYYIQEVTPTKINLFFGHPQCVEVMKRIIKVPLNELSPEEDFIVGTLLGYDLCLQCDRYCTRKDETSTVWAVS